MTATVAVVTGAAGIIGRAIGHRLAQELQVVGIDRTAADASFPILAADVTDRGAVEATARAIATDFGDVSVVVSNAGALTMNRFLDLSDDDWRTVLDVNAYGTFLVGQVFARAMRSGGRIINIASVAAKVPLPDQAHYCASKAAVVMLSRVMALELASAGIRVFSICPGAVDTALFRACLTWTADRDKRSADELLDEWLSPSRLGRFVRPEEVAELVRYLALGPADPLTGHAISVDGGVAPW